MTALDTRTFDAWLKRYGEAWEGRDPAAAAKLFTPDAAYHWTPHDPPQRGPEQIAQAWDGAVSRQSDIRFTYEVLAVTGSTGIAHWHARFKAVPGGETVNIDGMLTAELDGTQRCRVFREWWHMVSG